MKPHHSVVLLGATLAVAGCGADAASPGEIAFQGHLAGADRIAIQTVRAGGDEPSVLLGDLDSGVQRHIDWSRDGRRLVVTAADDQGADDLWVADADGTDLQLLVDCSAPCVAADEAAWSPDGTQIAFYRIVASDSTMTSTLETLDVESGTTSVVLTADDRTAILAPRWSPDGQRLVVELIELAAATVDAEVVGGAVGVVDLDIATPTIRIITEPFMFANNPDWSPTDDLVVFAARIDPDTTYQDLFVADPSGSDLRRLTHVADAGGIAVQPSFTPGGEAVLFVRKPDANIRTELAVVDVESGEVRNAVEGITLAGEHPRQRPES